MNRVDPDGMVDKEWLKKGGVTFGTGLIATVGGGVAVFSGVGSGFGAYAISVGIPAMGLGTGMLITGLLIDPSPEGRQKLEAMPTGVLNAIGKASDMAFETENHELEKTADLVDAMLGLGTLSKPKTITDVITNGATLFQAGVAVKNMGELLDQKNDTSSSPNNQDNATRESGIDWQEDLRQHMIWTPPFK